jgi:ATP-dependent helicase/nuclease subunit A
MADLQWTAQQAEALTATEHVLLTANAGTGKTTTIVGKIMWLLGIDGGVDRSTGERIAPCPNPCEVSQIVAITFTDKAAVDLRKKLRQAIDTAPEADDLRWRLDEAFIGTIHGFCGSLLREHSLRLGIDPSFRVLDERASRVAQNQIVRETILGRLEQGDPLAQRLLRRYTLNGFPKSNGAVDLVRSMFSDLRWYPERYASWHEMHEAGLTSPRVVQGWDDPDDADALTLTYALYTLAARALQAWNEYTDDENARDFDSLILDARTLLTADGGQSALAEVRRRCRILIIDEFQDTNGAQRDIAFAIAGEGTGPQLFLVGDPKQSIYGFRGADIAVWNEVAETIAERGRILSLTRNFRSEPAVVEVVNEVCRAAMSGAADELGSALAASAIAYEELEPERSASEAAGLEWIPLSEKAAADRRREEGLLVGARIQELVAGATVIDPDSGQARPCRYSDIAILYRNRTNLGLVEEGLRGAGVRYHIAGAQNLSERLEIVDLLNAMRLLHNPDDDLRAFGYLRSPFVGLRDEVIARIRIAAPKRPLLRQAGKYLDEEEWPEAPEGEALAQIEQESLRHGLEALRDARRLVGRIPLDEVLDRLLSATGYRTHLLLGEGYEEALSNIQNFLSLIEGYRDLSIDELLELWDQWAQEDLGIPQAALHSQDDNIVTLSTVHGAKGLEWPVIFMIKTDHQQTRAPANKVLLDREHGAVLCLRSQDRGERGNAVVERDRLQAVAEETRLLYVLMTRTRDRLIVVGKEGTKANTHWSWLEASVSQGSFKKCQPVAGRPGGALLEVPLEWLNQIELSETSLLACTLDVPQFRFTTSASELMTKERDPEEWKRRYVHGVQAPWAFTKAGAGGDEVPPHVRGTLIHGVLERIQEETELSRILDETIGSLDEPQLDEVLGSGSNYRTALEEEIRDVVRSSEWTWYVEGEHYRELEFVHLAGQREWWVGAFDLYRPDAPDAVIVDFKTHEVGVEEVEQAAEAYRVQARVYREAAGVRGDVDVRLHFTRGNVTWPMKGG